MLPGGENRRAPPSPPALRRATPPTHSRPAQHLSQPFNAITIACTAVPRVAHTPAANWPAAGPSAP
ncbi:hypothetical protein L13192_01408 [Pyrenophora tritici-repentis]|uniref:Uncharacterized protein n=1 Tax=Pyrenophora tritici-repentis TaxID=45151 RepID=A0A922NSP9_9PLEO|nr:hypothetical protein Ptr86124_001357 [Pyrenophora tritici-repentis]KAI1674661.1 hypothetical protein L13192_01408 [Pyrenophora tritici-repentis]KAI1688212.1 hypothetical protein KJE20_01389 [Pyrenophora tritici-repentis]